MSEILIAASLAVLFLLLGTTCYLCRRKQTAEEYFDQQIEEVVDENFFDYMDYEEKDDGNGEREEEEKERSSGEVQMVEAPFKQK